MQSAASQHLLLDDAGNDVTVKLCWTGLYIGEYVENYSFRQNKQRAVYYVNKIFQTG